MSSTFPPTTGRHLDEDTFIALAAERLAEIYGPRTDEVLRRLLTLLSHQSSALGDTSTPRAGALWSERDQWLITYGDSLLDGERPPLEVLDDFLETRLDSTFSGVHVLPFFPWSSDDGFSVIHYREVNPALGDWSHIRHLANHHDLMVDLVINHVSRESLWFVDYLAGSQPGRDYFIEMEPDTDLSAVTRPRNTPLLVPVSTRRGTRHVWATFSDDQIDLNFANPDVLLEFIGILLYYIEQGARIIRLDAIAYLWKDVGTSCIHLPQTHAVVRLLRAVADFMAPGTLLVTETNVPHRENLSYLGLERLDSQQEMPDEAHLIYQFTLPPLLVHTLTSGEAATLAGWLKSLPALPPGCSYLNFTASHDGIGVRALEGLLPEHEVETLLELMHRFGGFVSMKANPDGKDSPYEINITYFEALKGTRRGPDPWQVERFLCSQHLMMALQGIPALYLHSLTATLNDHEGIERSGRLRSINRRRWQKEELDELLDSRNTPTREVFLALKRRLAIRRSEPCFHPEAPQRVLDTPDTLLAIERGPLPNGRRLLAIYNVTDKRQPLDLEALSDGSWFDLLEDVPWETVKELRPYRSLWLVLR
ncbi:alpha-amylase [Litchfieldella anticariensis FP35 = DSM 16096]|uniref:Alpha-amylase n=1 Tax=Litchfieldella anticariensis (strain DSM 16096 / CECT 5854 / CIP 108499 / LMG 22089 / FP35) TaxID=1121939 RepID=S2L0N7_LITA3|nr:sugar phosphorylase [Halomonas anticariensis]EPC01224.1 alpha-amylase [Halomonas anticariensis FP35 = DSM 16096]